MGRTRVITFVVLLLFALLFHLFCQTLDHLDLLDWKHLLEKNPRRLSLLLALGGNAVPIKITADLLRILLFILTALKAVTLWGVAATVIGGIIVALFATITSSLILLGDRPESTVLILFPLVKPFMLPLPLFFRSRGEEEEDPTDEDVNAYLSLGQDEGIIEPQEGKLFQSLVDFSDTLVREVMTPRTDMVTVRKDTSWNDLIKILLETRHSRIPVTGDNLDDALGVVHVKDCLEILYEKRMEASLNTIMRDPWFVPETKRIVNLLQEMRQSHQHMAIVVDEYGGIAGLVTLEDLIEEIVGEISDEYEEEEDEVREVSPGIYSLDGKVNVDLLDDLFGVTIDDVGYDTVGGLVVTLLGNVPAKGTRLTHDTITFEVLEADDRRVKRVKVWKGTDEAGGGA